MSLEVREGMVVEIEYTLRLPNGQVVDQSQPGQPLQFLEGAHQIIPGLEKAIEGMKVNEERTVEVKAADAYGDHRPELIQTVAKSQFPEGAAIEPGMVFTGQDEQGNTHYVRVVEVQDDQVVVDLNHPLAGQDLVFQVKVVGLREATDEEKAHGHVH